MLIFETVHIFENLRYVWLQVFQIGDPVTGTTVDAAQNTGPRVLGACVIDTFSISSQGNAGSPIICGFNTGQHSMYF